MGVTVSTLAADSESALKRELKREREGASVRKGLKEKLGGRGRS
jgi:hypothetical protein